MHTPREMGPLHKFWIPVLHTMLEIVSGGQTGVDRAALDAALDQGFECGGWCPRGRKAEDGIIGQRYPLQETPSKSYSQRTKWNVRDSDGTLILCIGPLSGGTALTKSATETQSKPCFVVDLNQHDPIDAILEWITTHQIHILNVAGPRESQCPGIADLATTFLIRLFASLVEKDPVQN